MDFIISATTDIGNTKNTNQDSYNARVIRTQSEKMAFAVLCDGMGGLSKGEVASASVVKAFCNWVDMKLPILCGNGLEDADIQKDWCGIAIDFNEKIKNYGKKCGLTSGVGTTVTAILITEKKYYIINVGDTRAYEIMDKVSVLTKDQTVVSREVELGNLTEEQAKYDARRSVLLQCIGASDYIYPDIFIGNTKKDAVYMLCSDGFRHEISNDEIYNYLNPSVMLDKDIMKKNMDTLVEINKQRQERDNITVVSIRTY